MVHVGDASKAHPLHRYDSESIHGVNVASWLVGYWRMRRGVSDEDGPQEDG
jgi:hypothetical protein